MKKIGLLRACACAALLPALSLAVHAATQLWVDAASTDPRPDGSAAHPWPTLGQAQAYIRTQTAAQADDIVVNLVAGEYVLSSTLAFTPADSAGAVGGQHWITYQSADGVPGSAKIVGAAPLQIGVDSVAWQRVAPGSHVWKIKFAADADKANVAVGTLYENGQRSHPTRSPKYVAQDRYPLSQGPYKKSFAGDYNGTDDWLQYSPGDFSAASWTPLTNAAQVVWWGGKGTYNWGTYRPARITFNDSGNNKLNFKVVAGTGGNNDPTAGERYYVQGVGELLDGTAPGEFFYNANDGYLYYCPQAAGGTGDPTTLDIRVPTLARLISITGTWDNTNGDPATHVHHLRLSGVSFAYTAALFDHPGHVDQPFTLDSPDPAVYLKFTDHIQLNNCEFVNLGSAAVYLRDNNQSDQIYGCWMHHCGLAGVLVYNGNTAASGLTSDHHLISNCLIDHIGEVSCAADACAGVFLRSTNDCEVSYCDISDCVRYGLTLRGNYNEGSLTPGPLQPATHNTFHHIKVTDGLQDSGDAGMVHAAGLNISGGSYINTWEQLVVSGAYADRSMDDVSPPNGVFLDYINETLGQVFRNIAVNWTQGAAYRTHGNNTESFTNVSWAAGFDDTQIDYLNIGLRDDFPSQFADRTTVVSDDRTNDHAESGTPAWQDSTIGNLYRGDGRYQAYAATAPYAEWKPALPYTGDYQVWVWKMDNNAAASTVAPYTVYSINNSQTLSIDQTVGAGGWTQLGTGTFHLAGGRAGGSRVRLTDNATDHGAVRADAVKFVLTAIDPAAIGDEHGWWNLEGGTDSSGNGNAIAALPAGASYTTDATRGGKVLVLDGSTGYADIAASPVLDPGTGDFTISTWFYRQSNAGTSLRLLSKGSGTTKKPGYAIFGSDTQLTAILTDAHKIQLKLTATIPGTATGVWRHLAVTFNRTGNLTMYFDGVAYPTTTDISSFAADNLTTTDHLNLGRDVDSGGLNWPGRIDDVRLFKRVLSPAEIAVLANQ